MHKSAYGVYSFVVLLSILHRLLLTHDHLPNVDYHYINVIAEWLKLTVSYTIIKNTKGRSRNIFKNEYIKVTALRWISIYIQDQIDTRNDIHGLTLFLISTLIITVSLQNVRSIRKTNKIQKSATIIGIISCILTTTATHETDEYIPHTILNVISGIFTGISIIETENILKLHNDADQPWTNLLVDTAWLSSISTPFLAIRPFTSIATGTQLSVATPVILLGVIIAALRGVAINGTIKMFDTPTHILLQGTALLLCTLTVNTELLYNYTFSLGVFGWTTATLIYEIGRSEIIKSREAIV